MKPKSITFLKFKQHYNIFKKEQFKMEKRLDDSLQYISENWQHIVKKYQEPNTTLAITQIFTSFLPFKRTG